MARSSLLTFLVSAATAFAVWALSPLVTGFKEPWDAPGIYYYVALLLAGIVSGLFFLGMWSLLFLGGAHVGSLGRTRVVSH